MEEAKKIFIVDDDVNVIELIKKYLVREGYLVETFGCAEDVLIRMKTVYPDMFVIDIMMPGIDGYELCKEIRRQGQTPIIMVSAKDDEIDKVLGLELGSDDYLSKPFSPRELVARVKNIFRRVGAVALPPEKSGEIVIGDLKIFPDERKVLAAGQEVEFTTKEFEFLEFLAANRGKVFNREQILN